MSLRNRLQDQFSNDIQAEIVPLPLPARSTDTQTYQDLKLRTHSLLLDNIDLKAIERLPLARRKDELTLMAERLLNTENVVINDSERKTLVRDILHEMLGLGPLELLMADPTVSDILVNACDQVYVERHGRLESTDVRFRDNAHLMKIIDKIVSGVGRRLDEASPMVDARLPDGSRVNVIIPPLAVDGPILSIRRFSATPLTMDDFLRFKSVTPPMAELLEGLVRSKLNIIVSGGTGSGKTTLLNILSSFIGGAERVVTIEDTAELRLQQEHVVRLESRPPNIEGKGEISQRALVKNAMRMRPDRIIVGEVRGAEAIDMLQAMNSGHDGSLATLHANSPRDALMRLENMIGYSGLNLPPKAMRQQISSAVAVVVQIARLTDGTRRLVSLQEITGIEGEMIAMQEIFSFRQTGVAADGSVQGHFCATGARPRFCDRLQARGIALPPALFAPDRRFDIQANLS